MRTSKKKYNTTGLESSIFEGLSETSDRRYLLAYNLNTGVARVSRNAVEYFGLEGEYMTELLDSLGPLLHVDDIQVVMNALTSIITRKKGTHFC